MSKASSDAFACPVPLGAEHEIQLAHGGGGRLTQRLIDEIFAPAFQSPIAAARHDGAVVAVPPAVRLALTTDAHVVSPLFFPGGDIGQLAVNGTTNDLAMCGARPRWLTAGFILEEGLPLATLRRIVDSMAVSARAAGVEIVAGDTKVVERGQADGMYLTLAGIGWIEHALTIAPSAVRAGDVVLASGDIGRHGMAILAQREGIGFESVIESDCAPLWPAVAALLEAGIELHCLRDLTRGGLATAVIEIAENAALSVSLEEAAISVSDPVRGACELLGIDPLYVANEGRFIAFVPEPDAKTALAVMARTAPGGPPSQIGAVRQSGRPDVTLKGVLGVDRVLERLTGEQLPRIC